MTLYEVFIYLLDRYNIPYQTKKEQYLAMEGLKLKPRYTITIILDEDKFDDTKRS